MRCSLRALPCEKVTQLRPDGMDSVVLHTSSFYFAKVSNPRIHMFANSDHPLDRHQDEEVPPPALRRAVDPEDAVSGGRGEESDRLEASLSGMKLGLNSKHRARILCSFVYEFACVLACVHARGEHRVEGLVWRIRVCMHVHVRESGGRDRPH